VLDLFLFYIFFEGALIPMFIMIGIWGSRQRKVHAAYQFFLYTLTGSVLMLLVIIYIHINLGTTYWGVLINTSFSFEKQMIFWLAIFISLAVKIPMMPVHIWLPEAHVEAPTAGSVLLAGILLKMGGYGFLRFLIPIFPDASHFFSPMVCTLALVGIIYSAFATIRQIDLKKIIAYSSIGHMNFVILGIFSGTIEGIEGSIFLMISHGIVSSGLFMCVGILYDRYKTRTIEYYGGLSTKMPIFSILFFILTLANIGMPGTSSFVGEVLILIGIMQFNSVVAAISFIGMILAAVYSIWLFNRVMFGNVKSQYISSYSDLEWELDPQRGVDRETFMLVPLIFLIIFLGIYPNIILDSVHCSVIRILELQSIDF
jgi:proton-translocating NADH-quinone oxidoreductase chain M